MGRLQESAIFLSTTDGCDKVLRLASYGLLFASRGFGDPQSDKRRVAILQAARELSLGRLILRRLGDIPMWLVLKHHFSHPVKEGEDKLGYYLKGVSLVAYALFYPAEHLAWLSGLGLLPFKSKPLENATILLWIAALSASIIRKEAVGLRSSRLAEVWGLLASSCDMVSAINFLPAGWFLWSGSLPVWKVGAFGTISSLIMLKAALKK